jgi:excisionase family DNA binding protein
MEKLYSLYQVARIFDVDYQTVWRWVKKGRIPAFKTPGNQWRVRASAVEEHLGGLD